MKTKLACAFLFVIGLMSFPLQLFAADHFKVALVRQDFSDCVNSDVTASDPSQVGGFMIINAGNDGSLLVFVHLESGTPATTYHLFVKCVGFIGDLYTNPRGVGNAIFTIPAGTVGPVFAFDMYPDGAPLGNKFQSVQVDLTQ
jgi:hypothetical protein